MMMVEYVDPADQKHKIMEYERSHPMPADPPEKETVETRHLFKSGKWGKNVSLQTVRDILGMLPVGAEVVRVDENDHRVFVE